MKKAPLTMAILTLAMLASAQTGKVLDELTMDSKILDMERKYAIYLPPDYETSERSYPVLYLLHGAGDDQTGWVQFGEVLHIADRAILEGSATPMIIVMPDGNTKRRGKSSGNANSGTIGSKSCPSAPSPCSQITLPTGLSPVVTSTHSGKATTELQQ